MKKVWRVILIVLLIAFIAGAALAWHYRDYLRAFVTSRQYSAEDLQQQMDDNEALLAEIAAQYLPELELEPETGSGSDVSSEQPVISGETPSVKPAPITPEKKPPEEKTPEEKTEEPPDLEISALVASFYSLRDEFGTKLDDIKSRAYAEYQDKRPSKSELVKMAMKYVREAALLEEECDNRVLSLLDQLEKLIKKTDGDSTLPDKILELYLNEKKIKRAWYISELEKRGLVL